MDLLNNEGVDKLPRRWTGKVTHKKKVIYDQINIIRHNHFPSLSFVSKLFRKCLRFRKTHLNLKKKIIIIKPTV